MPKTINKNKFMQYELWKDCIIGCTFCCNKKQPDLDKKQSLQFIINNLQTENLQQYNEIGFIGGQFFNVELKDDTVKKLFYKLFQIVSKMHFQKIYITTALIYDMNNYLIPFLDYLKSLNILNKILLCTSYDIKYRFHTLQREQLWKSNMFLLYKLYPELKIHTEIIVTQAFINAVLENKFNITQFSKTYNTRIDYIQPGSGLYYYGKEDCAKDMPQFFPSKQSFIKFLKKVAIENHEIDLNTFLSMELRSSRMYYIDGGKRLLVENRRDTNGVANPVDKTKKYEIGFIDSEQKMVNIARELGNLYVQ